MVSQAASPQRYMQGIAVPAESVQPQQFFARTRRQFTVEKTTAWAGFGGQDFVEVRRSGILSALTIKFTGTLVISADAGQHTTARWPYDLMRGVRFTANGQSNIINVSGAKLKLIEMINSNNLDDRGVPQTIGGVARTQGTLSTAAESWGVGSNSAIAAGTYAVELVLRVPVAEDDVLLHGAIFAATSSTDLNLIIDWEQVGNLFTGYTTAPTLTGTLTVESEKFTIPQGSDGEIIIPDLSSFHSLIQTRSSKVANGDNEERLLGQGAGKALLRLGYQVWNGAATAAAPLPMVGANFGRQAWRYAGNETPEEYFDGQTLREINEHMYGQDIGGLWGFGVHDFVNVNALRDTVDMGTTSELRLFYNITTTPTLASPALEYWVETMFMAGSGA